MNLFADFLDIGVQDLPLMERLCRKHIFIYRTPENTYKLPVSTLKNPILLRTKLQFRLL